MYIFASCNTVAEVMQSPLHEVQVTPCCHLPHTVFTASSSAHHNTVEAHRSCIKLSGISIYFPFLCRRLSGIDKSQHSKAAEEPLSLEEKLEERLGGFGQNAGVNPAHKPSKPPAADNRQTAGHAVPKENRSGHHHLTLLTWLCEGCLT